MKTFILFFVLISNIVFAQDFDWIAPVPPLEYTTNYFTGWDGMYVYAINPPPVIINAVNLKSISARKLSPLPPPLPLVKNNSKSNCITNIYLKVYLETVQNNQTNVVLIKRQILN